MGLSFHHNEIKLFIFSVLGNKIYTGHDMAKYFIFQTN